MRIVETNIVFSINKKMIFKNKRKDGIKNKKEKKRSIISNGWNSRNKRRLLGEYLNKIK